MSKITKVLPKDTAYCATLMHLAQPPDQLYVMGKLPDIRMPTVAIVGSRKPTSYGREVTVRLSEGLARRGVVVVSGLALGVDAIAQKAALDVGGVTIAVLANGLHRIYPATNRQLAEDLVAAGGAIVSEYDAGVEPMQYRFLERNRIVSGLADAVIITEAAGRSGTLNTASHAAEQGRDLYAVPGPITSPMSVGCNAVIRQGAIPIVNIDEFINEITGSNDAIKQSLLPIGDTPAEEAVIDALIAGVRDGEDIQSQTKLSASELNIALTMLEVNGVIEPLGNNQWRLR